MAIILPGYNAAFEDKVYCRDRTVDTQRGHVVVSEIVILERYTEPTEDGVVNYLREVARKVDPIASLELPDSTKFEGKSPLEEFVMKLPKSVRMHLISGRNEYLNFVRKNTYARALSEGENPNNFVQAMYGLLTPVIISNNFEMINDMKHKWYDAALSNKKFLEHSLGYKLQVDILLYDEVLPSKIEMNILLKHKVSVSRSLIVQGTAPEDGDVERLIELLYSGLDTPDKIEYLEDHSKYRLEEASIQPVINLLDAAARQQAQAQTLLDRLKSGAGRGSGGHGGLIC